jgi:hypothetical protein
VSRGDVVYALAQRLADLAADAEGQPRRPVPRLQHDTSLPHQVTVLAGDLLAAGSAAQLDAGTEAVTTTAQALS